jgi:hypothetical protein
MGSQMYNRSNISCCVKFVMIVIKAIKILLRHASLFWYGRYAV